MRSVKPLDAGGWQRYALTALLGIDGLKQIHDLHVCSPTSGRNVLSAHAVDKKVGFELVQQGSNYVVMAVK